ncbi:hypothetical protein DER29_2680 [Micromonospora sp. M71_S20]|nr:hypothetical protein DER29_2680 [Micromonospora sp. M71_S20]
MESRNSRGAAVDDDGQFDCDDETVAKLTAFAGCPVPVTRQGRNMA